MYSSSLRQCLTAAATLALLASGVTASHHRRSVPPFQIKPTRQFSAKAVSGIPKISWPNAHANETYIALGLEMPIVGILGSDPELIFLGAESYLLFMQEGMTMSAYSHLNISDSLLSSSIEPLVAFNEPAGIFSESPFSSDSDSADLRLLAVLLYQSDTQSQSVAKQSPSSSPSSSSEGVLSEVANLLDRQTQETEEFDWNAWAADMNANPLLRTDFDVSDFATKAGLGNPVAAEVLIIKDEAELTDPLDGGDGGSSWDIVSTLYQTGAGGNAAGTAAAADPAASGMGAPASAMGAANGMGAVATGARTGPAGLGLMPSSGAGAGAGAGAGNAMNPSGAASGLGAAAAAAGAAATGSPLISTGPDSESDEDTGAGPVIASSGTPGSTSTAGFATNTNASPSSSGPSGDSGSSSGGLAVIPVASNSSLGASANTGRPSNSTGPVGTSDSGSDDTCDDDDNGSNVAGEGPVTGSGSLPLTAAAHPTGTGWLGPSGMSKQPKYPLFPQYSGTTPTNSAAGAGITGGSKAAATAQGEQVTIDIDIGGEFETTITANLKYRNARRTADVEPDWTLTLKTDLVAPTSSLAKMTKATSSTVATTSTPKSVPRYVYRQERSTLQTTTTATGRPSPAGSVAPSSLVTTSSAVGDVLPTQALSLVGLVCITLLFISLW